MEIIVDITGEKNYLFKKNLIQEISQNIENIVTRIKGNVVLARHKGINDEHIDKPFELVKAEIIADCMEEIEREEPRFNVEKVEIISNEIFAKMKIKIIGEVINE